ncbi:DUF6042 family protein [Streptomyces angustmyceticus]|uniref:DUF6042 family protein n=1 Tax=Streptomyces angustmyceticus TaxID=285578 RepID=UPI001CBFF886|nr:DUF6042 family protein [Streptomyces angustmyceticus]
MIWASRRGTHLSGPPGGCHRGDADDVRIAFAELVEAGDAQVRRGQEQADAERLEAHQRFRLVMNWDHCHKTRMRLSVGRRRATETGPA